MPSFANPSLAQIPPPDSHTLLFPRSDGDSSRRPDNTRTPPSSAREVNWYRPMTTHEKYAHKWRTLIGQEIARLLNKPEHEKYYVQNFPEGYWMFDHNKGPISNVRHDIYLFGSKTVKRFRSPAEFIPHGYWLITDPTLNTKNCSCKYCGGGGGNDVKKSQTEISALLGLPTNRGPTAITGMSLRGSAHVPKEGQGIWLPLSVRHSQQQQPQHALIHEAWATRSLNLHLATSPRRISDLTSGRRFRIGELVWSVVHGAAAGVAHSRGGDFAGTALWPAVVLDSSLEANVMRSATPRGGGGGGGSEGAGGRPYSVRQRRLYSVLRLGALSEDDRTWFECTLREDYILPWQAFKCRVSPPNTTFDARNISFMLALQIAKHLVDVWAVCGRLPIDVPGSPVQGKEEEGTEPCHRHTPQPPPAHLSSRDKDPPSQRSPVRLKLPGTMKQIKDPDHVPAGPTPSISISPSKGSSQLPTLIPQVKGRTTVTENRYEGLWYGAERIWMGDLVRLLPERDAFIASLSSSGSSSQQEQQQQQQRDWIGPSETVLMRVDRIFARPSAGGSKECAVAGPLYELVPDAGDASRDIIAPDLTPDSDLLPCAPWDMLNSAAPPTADERTSGKKNTELPPFPLPTVPAKNALHPLLPAGLEVAVPASFVAGRFYPDLFQWPLIRRISSQIPFDEESTLTLGALVGLRSAYASHAVCVNVRLDDRVQMLREAENLAQRIIVWDDRMDVDKD